VIFLIHMPVHWVNRTTFFYWSNLFNKKVN